MGREAKKMGGGLPWYQATPRSVMLSSGWIMAFQSTEGVCGPERCGCGEMLEDKAELKGVQNARPVLKLGLQDPALHG